MHQKPFQDKIHFLIIHMLAHLIPFILLDFIVQNFLAVDVRVERFDQQLKAASSILFVSARQRFLFSRNIG